MSKEKIKKISLAIFVLCMMFAVPLSSQLKDRWYHNKFFETKAYWGVISEWSNAEMLYGSGTMNVFLPLYEQGLSIHASYQYQEGVFNPRHSPVILDLRSLEETVYTPEKGEAKAYPVYAFKGVDISEEELKSLLASLKDEKVLAEWRQRLNVEAVHKTYVNKAGDDAERYVIPEDLQLSKKK